MTNTFDRAIMADPTSIDDLAEMTIALGPGCSLRLIGGWWHIRFRDARRRPRERSFALRTQKETIAVKRGTAKYREWLYDAFDPWQEEISAPTLAEAKARYLTALRRDGRRASTIETADSRLSRFTRDVPETTRLDEVTPDHIRAAVYRIGYKRMTQYTRYQSLQAFFNWCVREGLIKRSPCDDVDNPRQPESPVDYFTDSQFRAFIAHVEADYEAMRGRLRSPRQIIWVKHFAILCVTTGLRRGEAINLRWGDVHLPEHGEQGWIRIGEHGSHRPKWDSVGSVPLPPPAVAVLVELAADRIMPDDPGEYVFKGERWGRLNPNYVTRTVKKYIRAARLPENLSVHSFRDTFASRLVQQGVDIYRVQKLLRQKDVSTTARYAHLAPDSLAKSVNDVWEEV